MIIDKKIEKECGMYSTLINVKKALNIYVSQNKNRKCKATEILIQFSRPQRIVAAQKNSENASSYSFICGNKELIE